MTGTYLALEIIYQNIVPSFGSSFTNAYLIYFVLFSVRHPFPTQVDEHKFWDFCVHVSALNQVLSLVSSFICPFSLSRGKILLQDSSWTVGLIDIERKCPIFMFSGFLWDYKWQGCGQAGERSIAGWPWWEVCTFHSLPTMVKEIHDFRCEVPWEQSGRPTFFLKWMWNGH